MKLLFWITIISDEVVVALDQYLFLQIPNR